MNSRVTDAIIVTILVFWILVPTFFHIDGLGRTPLVLALFGVLLNWHSIKCCVFRRQIVAYVLLAIFMFLNAKVKGSFLVGEKGYYDAMQIAFVAVFVAPMLMMIVANAAINDFDHTVKTVAFGLLIYSVLSFFIGNSEGRTASEYLNANEVAREVIVAYFMILLLFIRGHKFNASLIAGIVISVGAVILTSSRMAFMMLAISTIAAIFIHYKIKNANDIIKIILFIIVAYVFYKWVMDNTFLGERLVGGGGVAKGEEFSIATGTFWDRFGDRGFQYYYSWPYFLDHPITGIGLGKWISYNIQGIVFHSEYLVQLVENGLIGAILYTIFHFSNINESSKHLKFIKRTNPLNVEYDTGSLLLSFLVSILLANFMLWTYNAYGIFCCYGLVYAWNYRVENNID